MSLETQQDLKSLLDDILFEGAIRTHLPAGRGPSHP